jgi:hypothetical protein
MPLPTAAARCCTACDPRGQVAEFSQFDNTAVIRNPGACAWKNQAAGLNNFGEVSVVAKWPSRLVV